MESQMMDIPHPHVVFTLPHQLNKLIKDNKWQLFDFLFKATSDSIKGWIEKLGLKIGNQGILPLSHKKTRR